MKLSACRKRTWQTQVTGLEDLGDGRRQIRSQTGPNPRTGVVKGVVLLSAGSLWRLPQSDLSEKIEVKAQMTA